MATARISATGLPIPQGGIGDILEGGRYMGPPRVLAGGSGGSGSNILKGILNLITNEGVMTGEDLANIPVEEREAKKEKKKKEIRTVQASRAAGMTAEEQRAAAERGDFGPLEMSKKDDDDIIEVKDEDLIREEKKDVTTGGQDPDEDPNKKTIIFDDPQTVARKLAEQEIQNLIDKSIDKLSEKYKEIGEKRKFDLYREDPSNLDDSLKGEIVAQIYNDNIGKLPFTSPQLGVTSIMDLISDAVPGVNAKETALKILKSQGIEHKRVFTGSETEKVTERILNLVDDKRDKYESYRPTIIKLFNENPGLSLNKLTKLVNEEIGPVTKGGGKISYQFISDVLEQAELRQKKVRQYPEETKNKIIDYLKENDRFKTIESTQVMKDLKLEQGVDFGIDTLRNLRKDLNLTAEVVDKDSLDDARLKFRNMLRKEYGDNLSNQQRNRLTQVFADYITDAFFDESKTEGYTNKMIAEAYDYATNERLAPFQNVVSGEFVPTLEEQIYEDFVGQLRNENIANMELTNKQLIADGKEPIIDPEKTVDQNLAVFRKWSLDPNNPDVFLTMGHARLGAREGQMGFADARMYEPETIRKNMLSRNLGDKLVSLWGDDENPNNLDEWIKVARQMEALDIRHVFQISNSDQTILIGREEPKPFPSEKKCFELKRDGGIVGIDYMTRPLNAQR